jgi:nicotinamide-nucleotide amidase
MSADLILSKRLLDLAAQLVSGCAKRGIRVGLAESCTGGLIAAAITAIPGSSAVLAASLVTYANAAKMHFLDVPQAILTEHGAVSTATAQAMVTGLLRFTPFIDLGLSITGIAGPDGGSAEKPVGLVFFAQQTRLGESITQQKLFSGDRHSIRIQAAEYALEWIIEENQL